MTDEKSAFAERLRAAMAAAGFEVRPVVLERAFNAAYWGRSVTFQTASQWLRGKSFPAQDKLQALADLFGVEPQALRYGEKAPRRIREPVPVWLATIEPQDRSAIEHFVLLSAAQRKLIRELIAALSKAG